MSTDRSDPSLAYTLPFQLTKKIHRKVPDNLQPERKENNQTGRIVVITGGGSGIGAAAAQVWVRAEAEGVIIAGRRKEVLDRTVHSLKSFNKGTTKILGIATDITVEQDVEKLFQQVKKEFGRTADVVIANAAVAIDLAPVAETKASDWWNVFSIGVLGLHNTVAAWIRSQPDTKNPVGTVINVNSGLAGMVVPGDSSYGVSKLAAHRYMEFVQADYPSLRVFTLLPGVVKTDMNDGRPAFTQYAKDEAEQTGALALFLASSRADYLKGSLTSINWDLDEMAEHKEEIEQGLLRVKWVPILPTSGGSGF